MEKYENKILFATGHRPPKIGGYGTGTYSVSPQYAFVVKVATAALIKLKPRRVIMGCALGWDQAVGQACVDLKIPFVAAIPFKGFNAKWRQDQQAYLQWLLTQAVAFHTVCDPGYEAWKLHQRNKWMVDNAEYGLALWDGSEGGTKNCINYAVNTGKSYANAWTMFEKMSKEEN